MSVVSYEIDKMVVHIFMKTAFFALGVRMNTYEFKICSLIIYCPLFWGLIDETAAVSSIKISFKTWLIGFLWLCRMIIRFDYNFLF